MMKLMISMSFIMNFLFFLMKHPMSMGLIILIQISILSLMTGLYVSIMWYSYIIFLIMIGALLILFIYMTSLIPNKKFKLFKKKMLMMLIFMSLMFYLMMNSIDENILNTMMPENNMFNSYSNNLNKEMLKELNFTYDKLNMNLTITLMLYLLFVLLIIVKIINMKMGAMRRM